MRVHHGGGSQTLERIPALSSYHVSSFQMTAETHINAMQQTEPRAQHGVHCIPAQVSGDVWEHGS